MQRINNGTQVAALPPDEGGAGAPGYFATTAHGGPTRIGQDWLNDVQEEIVSVIAAAGIGLSKDDRTQLLQAIQALISASASQFLIDAGLANQYVLTPATPIGGYAAGQSFTFEAINANTGGSTVNISGVGAVPIVHRDGTALQPGDIPAGSVSRITTPDGTHFHLESQIPTLATTALKGLAQLASDAQTKALASAAVVVTPSNLAALLATTAAFGLVELATDAEAAAMALNDVVITPSNLAGMFSQLLANPGYISLPGGFIFQWGSFSVGPNGAGQSVTYPISFPTQVLGYWTGVDNAASSMVGISGVALSNATVRSGIDDNFARTGRYFIIGN